MIISPSRFLRRIGCGALAFAAACAGPNICRDNRLALEAANQQVIDGQLGPAKAALEAFLVKTNGIADEFVLQRYFAAYLLSRVSLESSLRGNEWLEPLVAASYYLNFAEQWSKAAKASAPTGEEGEAMLPADLAAFGVDRAQTYLDVVWGVLCSRTLFQGEVDAVLAGLPGMARVKTADELCRELGMTNAMRVWTMFCLFEFYKEKDEPLAYTFGVFARELGREVRDAFPASYDEAIVNWILNESKYVYKSSKGIAFSPATDSCSVSGDRNIDFKAELKK
ncbi:MAG: hypothetical protein KDC98_11290 [Planctomycetes bacterium]|nr:hypothetical protein [Planctomycetota bacterium]